jgi:hypothetical protein
MSVRKIIVSLPSSLVDFADREAARLNICRSSLIAQALAERKAEWEERLAAEGHRFYAQEEGEFAAASASAVVEAVNHSGWAW